MSGIRLVPPDGQPSLDVAAVLERLGARFAFVETDQDAGRDFVGDMIISALRFGLMQPNRRERVSQLQAVQDDAVCIAFGDNDETFATCCVIPNDAVHFDPATEDRDLIERCALALGYVRVD